MFRTSKQVHAVRVYRVDFARLLWQLWRQGTAYAVTEYVRPTKPNGFEYECTNAGQSDSDEPEWPITIADTVIDGSIVWICRDFGDNATDLISSEDVVADTGLTIDAHSLDGKAVQFTVSGGTVGKTYDVKVTAVADSGDEYSETVRVTIVE